MTNAREKTLTTVAVSWRKKRRNHRILFGQPERMIRLDWRRRLAVFETGAIFGYERWRANAYGTIDWQIYVLKCGRPGSELSRVSGLRPGAEILFAAHGKTAAKRALCMLELVSDHVVLTDVSEATWRQISDRFLTRMPIEDVFESRAFP